MTFFFNMMSANFTLVRELSRPARIGLFLFFVAGLADGVLMPFFALWAQEAGVPIEYIGLLLGCYAGGELLATPFVGGIADRLGRRPVLLVSTIGVGTGFLLLYMTHGVLAAAISLILIGIFESVLHPTAATVVADGVPADKLRGHFALTRVVSSAGRVVGPAIGSLLVLWSLGLVFFGAAISLLIGALTVAVFLPETLVRGLSAAGEDEPESVPAFTAAFRDRRLVALLLPIALLEIVASWVKAVMPLYANNADTLTPSGIGLLFTFAAALVVVFQLPVIHASARMSGFSIVAASGLALSLAFGSLLISPGLAFLIAAVTLLSFSEMLRGPLTQSIATELAPRNARATYMAAFGVVGDLKDTAGPAIGTYLYALSASLPWLVGMPIVLVAACALAMTARRHEASE